MIVNVFQFPIYNKTPEEILKSLSIRRRKSIEKLLTTGLDERYAENIVAVEMKNKWDIDNYIIGFLYVDFRATCFEYRIAICRDSKNKIYKMKLLTETKHYMSSEHVNGVYTIPNDNDSNEEIAKKLLKDIQMICENDLKDVYCDISKFQLISDCIDYKKLLIRLER